MVICIRWNARIPNFPYVVAVVMVVVRYDGVCAVVVVVW